MRDGTVAFPGEAGKHSDRNGSECVGRLFAVKFRGTGGVYSNVVVCFYCDRELTAYENGVAQPPPESLVSAQSA